MLRITKTKMSSDAQILFFKKGLFLERETLMCKEREMLAEDAASLVWICVAECGTPYTKIFPGKLYTQS